MSRRVFNVHTDLGGAANLKTWLLASPQNVYVGRNLAFYLGRDVGDQRLIRAIRIARYWANPYKISRQADGKRALARYRRHLVYSGKIWRVKELEGANLACWCSPRDCHADFLVNMSSKTNTEIRDYARTHRGLRRNTHQTERTA